MIRIGNQTACWAATPLEPFKYALDQGFDAFEWFPDKKPGAGWDDSDLDQGARQRIRDTAQARNIRLSVHARWQANLLDPNSFPLVWKDLELARDLGAVLLNVHFYHEQGVAAFVDSIVPLIRRTAETGVQLAIENTPHHSPEQFNELFARLYTLGTRETSHVGMCLDLGHANLCSATPNHYLGFCDRLDPQLPINHLHLHENWGDADTHLPLFTGPASRDDSGIRGLLSRLARRNFSGSAILEQWPHPPSLLNNARDRLLQLWPSSGGKQDHTSSITSIVLETPNRHNATAEDFATKLVVGNQRSRSWREKLDFVRGLLSGDEPRITADQLIDVAIYLRFLGSGEIACSEDGRHFRPAHHARIASQIQERLVRLTTPDNASIIRKIYPWLPSSSPGFQRPEPLTRIRDIAHRNDIGSDLKREIKTTLQNKLHRCAGPEDLATSSALLERITAPGASYPSAFVEQFKIFHEELKEFFNARSLDENLAALASTVNARQADLIGLFLRQKGGTGLTDQLAALRTLTSLRQSFQESLTKQSALENQELLLADIALEDFAFVLLSEIINACERAESETTWESQIESVTLALKNLALSGIDPGECNALEAELRAWGKISPSGDRDEILRMKGTALRCRRLVEDFSTRTVALFAGRAVKLGRALGVADHAIRILSEADIRAHNIFQVAKLVTALLRRIRQRLGQAGWDVLVAGRAVGCAKTVDTLDQLERGQGEPLVVLLKNAVGDEEIPKNVVGVVLAHEMPHLSHLGVRARQAGVVFAACEEASEFKRLQSFEGQLIAFSALPDKVTWKTTSESGQNADQPQQPSPEIPAVRLRPESDWLPLDRVVAETGGGKASGARRLAELSRLKEAGFDVPPAIVVPFGVMEAQLAAAPTVAKEYRQLAKKLDAMPANEFAKTNQRLRELVQSLAVPATVISEVTRRFAREGRLIVRSSANCEDLEELAGAGLYDSVMNVDPLNVSSAIRTVWSSLWTRRATLSRQQAGIPHEQAQMAVLIQEMLVPDLSFVLHTVNPVSRRVQEVYAEIVVGTGDTLASAVTRGSPYRMVCDKYSRLVTTLAFANFSQASKPNFGGGLRQETVDYSQVELSRDAGARQRLGERLAAVGKFVEEALEKPQDIEGAVVNKQIYLVQTRPQPGLLSGRII